MSMEELLPMVRAELRANKLWREKYDDDGRTSRSFNATTAEAALRELAEAVLTGQAVGPSMFEIFEILGRDRSIERLRSGVPWFDMMNELGV